MNKNSIDVFQYTFVRVYRDCAVREDILKRVFETPIEWKDKSEEEIKIPFSLETAQYDTETFWGRFESHRAASNPFDAFYP